MRHILTSIFFITLFAACSTEDNENTVPVTEPAKRTVMVYMAAENNLSYYAQSDINEMLTGISSVSKWDHLLVFVDRASKTERPFILKLSADEQHPTDTVMVYEEDFYSSDAENMREVLKWMMNNYPADDYGLVLWGHADGWIIMDDKVKAPSRAFGIDNGDNSGSANKGVWMNIPSMRQALKSLPYKLKFIFADCCNMQCAEVAYELQDVTEYLIASPAEIPGNGAPYAKVIPDLFIYNDQQMYTQTCDDYTGIPIAAVRTEGMNLLRDATKDVLGTFFETADINPERDSLIYYYHNIAGINEHVMFDMNDFIRTYADAVDYDQWHNVFKQAVVYSRMEPTWTANHVNFNYFKVTDSKFGGMSMFIPLERYEKSQLNYNELIKMTLWYQAIDWSALGW